MNAISAAAAIAPRSERFRGCTARAAARNYRREPEGGLSIDSREALFVFTVFAFYGNFVSPNWKIGINIDLLEVNEEPREEMRLFNVTSDVRFWSDVNPKTYCSRMRWIVKIHTDIRKNGATVATAVAEFRNTVYHLLFI